MQVLEDLVIGRNILHFLIQDEYNLYSIHNMMLICTDMYYTLRSDNIWKQLFIRNFYICDLDNIYTYWYDYYLHVHNCYRKLENKCNVFQIKEEDACYDGDLVIQLSKLTPNIKRGDIIYLEHLSSSGESLGMFIYDGEKLQVYDYDYEITSKYPCISEFPIQYWNVGDTEYWMDNLDGDIRVNLHSFREQILDNAPNEAHADDDMIYTTFIYDYVQYRIGYTEIEFLGMEKDELQIVDKDTKIAPGLYSTSYRTIYPLM